MSEYGQPSPKGMPTWGKVALGCGIVAILALATCIGGGIYMAKRGMAKLEGMTQPRYQELLALVKQADSPEGLAAAYRANPGLARRYATGEAFAEALGPRLARVGPLPSTLPGLFQLMKEQRFAFEGGNQRVVLRYRNPGGPWIVGEWEGQGPGRLVDLRVE
jgi:hypothetical protein